jgi:aerobic carbon-monoxide dehydrogenase large subunit
LQGRGRFFDDLKLADQLYASIVRSPHAHADITGIDIGCLTAARCRRL